MKDGHTTSMKGSTRWKERKEDGDCAKSYIAADTVLSREIKVAIRALRSHYVVYQKVESKD